MQKAQHRKSLVSSENTLTSPIHSLNLCENENFKISFIFIGFWLTKNPI